MKGLLHHKNLAAFPAAFFCGLIAIPATGGSAPDVGRSELDKLARESSHSIMLRVNNRNSQGRDATALSRKVMPTL